MAKMKKKTRNILSIILVALLTIGAGFGIHAIVSVKTKTISPTIFSTGSLNASGEYIASKKSLYNENMFECQGLKIQRDFESTVTYDVHYYDVVGSHLGKESVTSEYYELPLQYANAKYCRVVIRPQGNKDIGFFERYSIAKQLTITVDKDQDYAKHNKLVSVNKDGLKATIDSKTSELVFTEETYQDEIACTPIKITDGQGNYYQRIVILSDYDLNEAKITTLYVVNQKDVNDIISTSDFKTKEIKTNSRTADGYFAYEFTFTSSDFKNLGIDAYLVFNFNRNQEFPQLYCYNMTVPSATA